MAEHTKNTAAPTSGAQKGSGITDVSGTQPKAGQREQGTERTDKPGANPSREKTPDVEAKKDAADTRRTADQAHVPTATGDRTKKPTDSEAGDAERTIAEGQGDSKPGHDPVKATGKTNTSGNR